MTVLTITNIVLAAANGLAGVTLLIEMARDNRPIVIKEAKALREYYESKLKDMEEKAGKAERDYAEYKELYNNELQRNRNMNGIMDRKYELEAQVERLTNDLNSCEDRLCDMAKENADLKEQIEALKKPVKKGKNKTTR